MPETTTRGPVGVGQRLSQRGQGRLLLQHAALDGLAAAAVPAEGQADDPLGVAGAGAQHVEVGQAAADGPGACGAEGVGGGLRPGQGGDGVAVGDQLGDHGGADGAGTDGAGAAGDEDAHEEPQFTEQGYDATTVAQIAERAGMTRSTFFRHFTDEREYASWSEGDRSDEALAPHTAAALQELIAASAALT